MRITKFTLWEQSAGCLLLIRDPRPGRGSAGVPCYRPVNLLDINRTVCAMAGVTPAPNTVGHDLSPLVADPTRPWNIPSLTTYQLSANNAIRTEQFRYIRYKNDLNETELYDHYSDVGELTNLAASVDYTPAWTNMNTLLETAMDEGTFPNQYQSSLENWRYAHWGNGLDAGNAADLADPDHDGVPNLMEYAAWQNPLRPDTNGPACLQLMTNSLRYTFNYQESTDPLVYRIQTSTNLADWNTAWDSSLPGSVDALTVTNHGDGHRTLQFPVPLVDDSQVFLRLKLTR